MNKIQIRNKILLYTFNFSDFRKISKCIIIIFINIKTKKIIELLFRCFFKKF